MSVCQTEENRTGSNSVLLTEATENKTALLFVNQTSALAGRGILSTQPLKCYNYMVSQQVSDLGWVDLDLGCSNTVLGQ